MRSFSRTRALIAGIVVASAAMLGGCATGTNGQLTGGLDPNFVQTVQTFTSTACAFIPTAASVIAIFNANVGQTAETVGTALCSAVAPKTASRGGLRRLPPRGGPPAVVGTVHGIKVEGWSAR